MNKKTIILMVLIGILSSCEDVENDRRLLIKGNFIDEDNAPIENVEVFTTFSNANFGIQNPINPIGQDFSDQDGSIQLVSLVPKNLNMLIVINRNLYLSSSNSSVTYPYAIFEIERALFQDVDNISLSDFSIPAIASLDINIHKISTGSAELNWSVTFNQVFCENIVSNVSDLQNLNFCDVSSTFQFQNNDLNPSGERTIETLRNSVAVFTYSINGQNPEEILIPIHNTSNTFDFEY